ncbi:MAG: phosphate butyryltransferase [Clostridiales bacterium]|nr:phosphate butyryltransferase [Clostridiales bacterium]
MIFHSFSELLKHVNASGRTYCVAIAGAEDEHTLEAVLAVRAEGAIRPLLVGDPAKITQALRKLGADVQFLDVYSAASFPEAAATAVRLVREGKADFIMKGAMETADILRAAVNKETGLGAGRVMSHMAINEIPAYHKLLVTTDGGMLLSPSLEQKKHIIENAVHALRSMGYERPKVGVLSAAERVNSKLSDSTDAAALREMNQSGEISNCIVEGPISFDLATVKARAEAKGYESDCAGDVDILLVPNITAGNILGKSLVEMAGAKMAGLVVGAKCPIVVTSRGSSAEEKTNALFLAAAIMQKGAVS